jgi:hypothetical protein
MQNAAAALSGAFAPKYKALLSGASRYEGVELRYLAAAAGRYAVNTTGQGVGVFTVGITGAPGEADIPTEVCGIIQKFGDGPPKRANGTTYVSGMPEDLYVNGRLTTPGVEALQGLGGVIVAPITVSGAEGTACNLSRTDNVLYPLIGYNAKDITGSLRRRREVR